MRKMAFALILLGLSTVLKSEEKSQTEVSAKILRMAVIGNSISQGANAINLGANPQVSWASGTDIESHLVKLEKFRDVQVIAKNVSVIGAESSQLYKQVHRLKNFTPDYATIEIGSNDICHGWKDGLVKNVKKTIDTLLRKNPSMEIILVPIPKLSSVYTAKRSLKCSAWWNLSCPTILGSLVSDEQRLVNQLRIDGMNYSLQRLANLYPQVYFNPALGEMDITEEDLSEIDCFHPSIEAQQKIADLTYPM